MRRTDPTHKTDARTCRRLVTRHRSVTVTAATPHHVITARFDAIDAHLRTVNDARRSDILALFPTALTAAAGVCMTVAVLPVIMIITVQIAGVLPVLYKIFRRL